MRLLTGFTETFKSDIECLSSNGKHYSKNKVTDSPFARSATANSKPLFDSKELETWLAQAESLRQLRNTTQRKSKEQPNECKKEWLGLQSAWLGLAPRQKDVTLTPVDNYSENKGQEHAGSYDSKAERNEHGNRTHHDDNANQASHDGHESFDEHKKHEKDSTGNKCDMKIGEKACVENMNNEVEERK
ncbi:hypothetical protein BGX26_012586, partial [Mortierella sp. AD094]